MGARKHVLRGLMAVAAVLTLVATATARDRVINVPNDDSKMSAAISKARETLPKFLEEKADPSSGAANFSLKVAISEGEYTEHFWLIDIKQDGTGYSGVIDNDPNYVNRVRIGERYEFKANEISDWLYMRDGKMFGAYTVRAMLHRMPKGQADRFRSMLAPQ